ncbi:glycoside hydrolase family 26 protein [Flammeovirga sp. OC4]|uniref:glycoside hydrolase family 26 protein n=1 Tax=Flammeovirga sp. OC4 TaxID=1382345 RepID=UPI0005C45918|nr:glycosyl hydrolase [Flammeovirga sp. OC4]
MKQIYKKTYFILLMLCIGISVSNVHAQIDEKATKETERLYQNLQSFTDNRFIFGHHFTELSGCYPEPWVDHKGVKNRSDVKSGYGTFPMLFGYDFGPNNFHKYEGMIKKAHKMGGVITVSWHAKNPVTGGKVYDTEGNAMVEIMPGGSAHKVYTEWLDEIVEFAHNVKVPVIFRPFHENTGNWFWWGNESCTPEEYVAVWRYTVDYLKAKKVHNFLYAYSPSKGKYDERYPGDDYVDICGMDFYGEAKDFPTKFITAIKETVEFANAHNKIPALTEFGYRSGMQNCDNPKFYTEMILKPIINDPIASQITFALTWRNNSEERGYWVPIKGDIFYDDFVEFHKSPSTIFIDDNINIYKKQ